MTGSRARGGSRGSCGVGRGKTPVVQEVSNRLIKDAFDSQRSSYHNRSKTKYR